VLVPMLAAALMIAATDLLTDEAADQRDGLGAAIVIAMVVLGLVPGAHTLVAQQQAAATIQAPAAFVPGADSPSSIAAP
jgi:di/tricarboxylate transporter